MIKSKIILGLDTSTDNCSVGLVINDKIIASRSEVAKTAHSEKLLSFIDAVLTEAGITVEELSAIGINIGPGSFTGLRIGLSTAKGMAFPLGIPVLPVKSLASLIESNKQQEGHLYFIKSHKNMVFFSLLESVEKPLTDIEINYDEIEQIRATYSDLPLIGNYNFQNLFNTSNNVVYPTGRSVAMIVSKNYDKLMKSKSLKLNPYYLTSFQAKKWNRTK